MDEIYQERTHVLHYRAEKKFAEKLNAIEGICIPEDKLEKQPGFPITVLTDRQKFDAFTGALDWFIEEVKQNS